MKNYELPELQILAFEIEDVITTSGGNGETEATEDPDAPVEGPII